MNAFLPPDDWWILLLLTVAACPCALLCSCIHTDTSDSAHPQRACFPTSLRWLEVETPLGNALLSAAVDPSFQAHLKTGNRGPSASCLPTRDGGMPHLHLPASNWFYSLFRHLLFRFNWNCVEVFFSVIFFYVIIKTNNGEMPCVADNNNEIAVGQPLIFTANCFIMS